MASTGSGVLPVFLDSSYSGGGPDLRWAYSWAYDAASDSLTVSLTLQGYSTTAGGSVYIGATYRTSGTPWIRAYCNDVLFYSNTSNTDGRHQQSGWVDIATFTNTITGTGGQARIRLWNYGRVRWNRSSTSPGTVFDSNQYIDISADRGLVYISTGSGYVPAIPYISDGTAWRQCIPYMSNGSTWEICS